MVIRSHMTDTHMVQEKEQPAFDASEFPALGGGARGQAGPSGEASGSMEGANLYANLSGMHKGMLPSEFNIQSEEFPALPGASRAQDERPAGEAAPAGPSAQVRAALCKAHMY